MTTKRILEGLQIFIKYDQEDTDTSAEHDILYAGATPPSAMADEDLATLKKLGWFWKDEFDCWAHFT